MTVVEPAREPRRIVFGEVLRAQPLHRGHERSRISRQVQREAIRAPLVGARHRVRDGQHHERHGARREQEQRQPRDVSRAEQADGAGEHAERARRKVEAPEDQRALEHDALPDVAVHVVRQLVREHDLDLFVGVLGQHRVRHQNPACAAEPGERRVRLLRLVAEPPFVRAEHARAGPIGQREEPQAQRFALERLHPVEQRQQDDRRQIGEPDDKEREHEPRRQPPPLGREPDEPVDDRRGAAAEHQPDREPLGLVPQPAAQPFVRKAVPSLDQKSAVEADRQAADLVQEGDQHDVDGDGAEDAAARPPGPGGRRVPEPQRQPAGQQPAEQQHGPAERHSAARRFSR